MPTTTITEKKNKNQFNLEKFVTIDAAAADATLII